MSIKSEEFRKLHQVKDLFVLPNAWDAKSAVLLQDQGFAAIGTSSAAVASSLGYEDGEKIPLHDYLFIVGRIAASVHLPVTVDFEMGYGRSKEAIYDNLQRLLDLGVVGVNLEDSMFLNGKRTLNDANSFGATIGYLKNKLIANRHSLFLNARCDTFLLKVDGPQRESARRAKIYESAGADGLFLPFICKEEDIQFAVSNTKLPVNVMCVPTLPDFGKLQELGVHRVSMGPFLQNKTYHIARELATEVLTNRNFISLL